LLSEAFGFLLSEFIGSFDDFDTYKGYRLLALDGTGCNIPKNPKHPGSYIKRNQADYHQLINDAQKIRMK
jgi:hypothetical protein